MEGCTERTGMMLVRQEKETLTMPILSLGKDRIPQALVRGETLQG